MKKQVVRWLPGTLAGSLLVLTGIALSAQLADAQKEQPPRPPLGLAPVFWPPDNPYSRAKAELGRLLYYDRRLSTGGTVSCASCHSPEHGFTDGRPVSTGIGGHRGARSSPTVINRAYSPEQFWDGRAPTLEEQAKGPLANPLEMTSEKSADAAHKACVACLNGIPGYRARFKQVFGTGSITMDQIARAIATFERTILSGDSPYDRYKAGDKGALTPQQIHGMDVFFNKAACDSCHLGFNFTDNSYVNIGIGMDQPNPDLGRYLVTHREEDRGAFKTPTLREIARTGPYMHDGRFRTLEQVVEHYDRGGIPNRWLDQRMKPLHLTPEDKKDLVAFLKALNGHGWEQAGPPKQFPK